MRVQVFRVALLTAHGEICTFKCSGLKSLENDQGRGLKAASDRSRSDESRV